MIILKNKTIYRCEFCRKIYQLAHFAIRHEYICYKNPVNDRICFRCVNLSKKNTEVFFDTHRGEGSVFKKLLYSYCSID